MAQNLTEHFVCHRYVRLTPHMIAKFRLDHAEGALDVGPLVIVPQELLAVEGEIMKHLLPEPTSSPAVDTLERNVGGCPMLSNDVRVVDARVPLVSRHFTHIEVRRRRMHEVREQLRITRIFLPDLN